MNLLQQFLDHLQSLNGFHKQHTFLVATSGGLDSVVLCDLFDKAGIKMVIAHCNFQLRGQESERDEQFVRQLAARYRQEIFLQKFDTTSYASQHHLSTQVAARDLRYNWFRQLLAEGKAGYIVTAHHADDNIETVAMNFFRGTGLRGLVGMNEFFQKIWRPLLHFRRNELVAYASENQLDHVEDSSNASSYYTRNYFRNELLPAVSKVFPGVEENILKNIDRLAEVEVIYKEAIGRYKKKLVQAKGAEEHIPYLLLTKMPAMRTILWEIVQEKNFTAAQADEIIKLMDAANGSYIESQSHRIIKNRNWLIIAEKAKEDNAIRAIDAGQKQVNFQLGSLVLEQVSGKKISLQADGNLALLDAKALQYPIILRKWRTGDYFYPLGMQKKKKLSRFFIDQKLSLTQKENVWVIESNKRIVWVIGLRIDDRFKLAPSSTEVLRIIFQPS